MMSHVGPVIKELAKQAANAAETGKSAKKGAKGGKEKDAPAVSSSVCLPVFNVILIIFIIRCVCLCETERQTYQREETTKRGEI